MSEDIAWPRRVTAGLGAWLFVTPFLWGHRNVQMANELMCGVLAMAFALAAARDSIFRYLNTALGLWVFASAFVLGTAQPGTVWNDVFVGTGLVAFSLLPNLHRRRRLAGQ